MVGGWEDGYRDAIMRFVAARPAHTWAVVGPWGHGWPHRVLPGPHLDWVAPRGALVAALVGGRRQRGRASIPQSRRSCRTVGVPTSICFIVRGSWVVLDAPDLEEVARAFVGHGDRMAIPRIAAQGMHAPVWCPDGDPADFALDQRSEDAAAATIDWPLVEDMRILGRPVAHLRLLTEGGDAQVVVRLCDVAPDGTSTLVAMGAGRVTTAQQRQLVRTPVATLANGHELEVIRHVLRGADEDRHWD